MEQNGKIKKLASAAPIPTLPGKVPGTSEEESLRRVFESLDLDGNGRLDVSEIEVALSELGLPAGKNYVGEVMAQFDTDGDAEITFEEFKRYVESKRARIQRVWVEIDVDGSGALDAAEVLQAAKALGLSVSPGEVEKMVSLLDRDGDSKIDYEEWGRFVALLPGAQVSKARILSAWLDSSDWLDGMEYRLNHIPPSQPLERFLAGGVAGAVSRTVVAPMERLRTIMMTTPSATRLGPALRGMWADGGVLGLFRGNLATVVKVFPSSALQYAVYDSVKDLMIHSSGTGRLNAGQQLAAGFISGAVACSATYPLETLRTQIQVARSGSASYISIVREALAERGLRGLYKGYPVAFSKDSLANALGFYSYEGLLSLYKQHLSYGESPSPNARGVIGGAAAFFTMTAIMPMENVMRRLQVQGRPGFPQRYSSTADCVRQMLMQEGVVSFWRGSAASWAKVVPSMAAARALYEGLIAWGGIGGVRRYRHEAAS